MNELQNKRQSLLNKIEELEKKISKNPDYIQKGELLKEVLIIEEEAKKSKNQEVEEFIQKCLQEGYEDLENQWLFRKEFKNYNIQLDLRICFTILVTDIENNELYWCKYNDFYKFKEALENLKIEEQLFRVVFEVPHISVNKNSVVETSEDLFKYWNFANYDQDPYLIEFEKI